MAGICTMGRKCLAEGTIYQLHNIGETPDTPDIKYQTKNTIISNIPYMQSKQQNTLKTVSC